MGELREEVSELRCVLLNKVIMGGGRGRSHDQFAPKEA